MRSLHHKIGRKFSLIELLVIMTVLIIIIGALTAKYTSNEATNSQTDIANRRIVSQEGYQAGVDNSQSGGVVCVGSQMYTIISTSGKQLAVPMKTATGTPIPCKE